MAALCRPCVWVRGREVWAVCPGATVPTAKAWVLGVRPKLFLLNWIMKPSSGCCVLLVKASWYTAHARQGCQVAWP